MSTNKVYGDNPNKLKIIEKKNRWELRENNKYFKGRSKASCMSQELER